IRIGETLIHKIEGFKEVSEKLSKRHEEFQEKNKKYSIEYEKFQEENKKNFKEYQVLQKKDQELTEREKKFERDKIDFIMSDMKLGKESTLEDCKKDLDNREQKLNEKAENGEELQCEQEYIREKIKDYHDRIK